MKYPLLLSQGSVSTAHSLKGLTLNPTYISSLITRPGSDLALETGPKERKERIVRKTLLISL